MCTMHVNKLHSKMLLYFSFVLFTNFVYGHLVASHVTHLPICFILPGLSGPHLDAITCLQQP